MNDAKQDTCEQTVSPLQATFDNEVRKRVSRETERMQKDVAEIEARGRKLELDLAIAQWAIAGILSRKLDVRIICNLDPDINALRIAKAVGDEAAHEFIRQAGLAFKDHARYTELLLNVNRNWAPHISTDREFGVSRKHWPKP